jgi:hypothetical protein
MGQLEEHQVDRVLVVPLRNRQAVTIRPQGVSDAQDGTNAFPGAMVALQNLVPAYHTASVFVPRPAAVKKIDFTNFGSGVLDLNFATQSYSSQGVSYALTSLPGYSYARTGSVAYANGTVGTAMLDNFAANVAPVVSNGTGYEAYGAETNYAVASGDISSASWTVFGGAAKGVADSAVAPDGTTTADAITLASGGTPTTASSQIYQNVSLAVSTTYTISAYVKSNTGANQTFRLKGNDNSIGDYLSPDLTATTQWQRFVFVFTTAAGATGFNVAYSNPGDGSATSLNVWGFQVLQGNFPDGGPVIATTTATASIGAPTLSMSCPNGSYTATYTFDDNSTQQIPTTISGGVFTMPTLGTLNRATVKHLQLGSSNPNGIVSEMLVVGSRVYGMVSSAQYAGKDEPFCFDLSTNAFVPIAGVTSALLPNSPASTGDWVPPVMRAVTNTYILCTHPGFPGGASPSPYFGWIDTSGYNQTVIGQITSGSNIITSLYTTVGNSAPILQGVQPGQLVTHADFPAGTYVVSCADGAFSGNTTGNTHGNTTLDGVGSTTGVLPGMTVSGPMFASGTYVASVSGSAVTLSQAALGTATGTAVNFSGGGSITVSANATASAANATITISGGTVSSPRWGAGNFNTNQLTSVPKCCYGFNSRAYVSEGPYLVYSDPLMPLQVSFATQAVLVGDSTDITAIAGVPLASQFIGGVQQSMTVFKGAGTLYQVTGDAASGNLSINAVAGSVGTLAPRSIVGIPNGLMFMAVDGLRMLGPTGSLSDPLNTDGRGVATPFLNALYPSRIVSAYSEDIYRVTTQDASQSGNPMSEYWFSISGNRWTGPHTIPCRAASGYPAGGSFLVVPFNVNAQIWQSDAIPNYSSGYTENGTRLQCEYRTVLLPDNQAGRWNKINQATLVVSLANADTVNVQVDDDRGDILGACSFNGQAGVASQWGSFLWGAGTWGAPVSPMREYFLNFPNPLVFRQARCTATFQASSGQAIGNLYTVIQPVNMNDV